jgi:5-methylcytosine-specific restriction endonuclease McrA
VAGDWLKMSVNLPDKPEVWQIAGMLGIDADSVVGKLLRVWAWFDAHTEDGNAVVPAQVLDRIACQSGFTEAMKSAGWLEAGPGGVLSMTSFDRHNGKSAKSRMSGAERVAKHRNMKRLGNAEVTEVVTQVLPRPIIRAVKERDGDTCVYCGRQAGDYTPPETEVDGRIHIDHVIPQSRGGTNDLENLVCACHACNLFKSNRTPDECGLRWPEVDGKRLGNTTTVTKTVTREEKRREEENTPPGFVRFWEVWPKSLRKEAKGKCLEAWRKAGAESQADLIVSHVETLKRSASWQKDSGQYIPAPLVYLNNRRWEGAGDAINDDPYDMKKAINYGG